MSEDRTVVEIDVLKTKIESEKKENSQLTSIYKQLNSKLELCCNDNKDLVKKAAVLKTEIKKIIPVFSGGYLPPDIDFNEIKSSINDITNRISQIDDKTKQITEYRNSLNINSNKKTKKINIHKQISLKKNSDSNEETVESLNNEMKYYYSENAQYKKEIANLRKEIHAVCPDIESMDIPEQFDVSLLYREFDSIIADIERMFDTAKKVILYRGEQNSAIVSELEGDVKK